MRDSTVITVTNVVSGTNVASVYFAFSRKYASRISEGCICNMHNILSSIIILHVMVIVSNMIICCNHSLRWRHNGRDGVSNHQPHDCLLKRLFRRRLKKTSKFRVTGLSEGSSPVTGVFPTQRASNTANVSIWWRHHGWLLKIHNKI